MADALVLSGGGAKGAFEAGVIAGLTDLGITPTILSGTSAGALNAAAVAVGLDPGALVELWTGLESRDVYRMRRDVHRLLRAWHLLAHPGRLLGRDRHTTSEHVLDSVGWTWLFETSPLRQRLVDLLGGETLEVQEGTVLSLSCVDAASGALVRFTNAAPPAGRERAQAIVTELTVDHLLASAAIPGLFAPVQLDGRTYWDGGLIANTPLTGAVAYQPDRAIVVATGAVDRDAGVPRSLGQVVSTMVDHLLRYAMVKDLGHTRTVNALVAEAPEATRHRHIELVAITPVRDRSGIGELIDFEPARAEMLVSAGRDAVRRAFDRADAAG